MVELFKDEFSAIHISAAIRDALDTAKRTNQSYFFMFNEIRVEVLPSDSYFNILDQYNRDFAKRVKANNKFDGLITWLRKTI